LEGVGPGCTVILHVASLVQADRPTLTMRPAD
jgi:hypothetical protein